jgi:ABC-2 type transport system ATP-binding protein/lipopolysaccharide transport system ATP-binding protein
MATINVRNVTLEYPIIDAGTSLRSALMSKYVGGVIGQRRTDRHPFISALRNISLSMKDGDRLGLVGHNGSGKTTLIRLLGGVLEPTAGSVEIAGRSATLITQGLGVDPEDTGLENIKISGLYLGMTPDEIEARTKEIAEFTELGDFLHLPVKTYSTGMSVRLAFAITTALSPEIMIMDEGIGAGDARFAKKAQERVDNMVNRCSIMVLASHSTSLIEKMCNQAALLHHGEIVARGSVADVLREYDKLNSN